ncbi:MAG: hypothetical protein NVV82_00230 [Sporocytophaga sp.]|nr:hypothetical protein [Sporocytophaga sp.]
MIKPERKLSEKAYEKDHIGKVLCNLTSNFNQYFSTFKIGKDDPLLILNGGCIREKPKQNKVRGAELSNIFDAKVEEFKVEQGDYQSFFDLETLEEYEDDPNAFKKDLTKCCPIIRRCINSPAKEMQKYKNAFRLKTGRELLTITKNIVLFGKEHMLGFDTKVHETVECVEHLGISKLLEDDYISYEVIGGGIKSNFLHSLYPDAFANRSQNSIWALWYLAGKDDFGFKDGSEFLMLDTDKAITQQNYHYPYDLFSFYALKIYLMLKDACKNEGYILLNENRYIYLDVFLDHIVKLNIGEINELRKRTEYELY